VALAESAIDALSYAVLFPDVEDQTHYTSLGGKPKNVATITGRGDLVFKADPPEQSGKDSNQVLQNASTLYQTGSQVTREDPATTEKPADRPKGR
jgi:hypothetical protein